MPNDSLPPRSFGNFIMRIFTVHKTDWRAGRGRGQQGCGEGHH